MRSQCVCGVLLQLYTQEFYETVVKQKLNPGGIFVTQSGPAGVMSASQVRLLWSTLRCSASGPYRATPFSVPVLPKQIVMDPMRRYQGGLVGVPEGSSTGFAMATLCELSFREPGAVF